MERHSALHQSHLDAHATLRTFYGWQMPAWYTEPSRELEQVRGSVGISDASYLTKFDVRGPFSVSLPGRFWKLTPARTLITSPLPIDLLSSSSVTDITSTYSAILLAGPKSRDVLHK